MSDPRTHAVIDLLSREAAYMDERQWDEWLKLFAADVEYWVPAWDSDTEHSQNPKSEMSLIYYLGRFGLEDRIYRIRSGLSSASTPLARTCHLVTNVLPSFNEDGTCNVRASWQAHVYRSGITTTFFGSYHYLLEPDGDNWLIKKKKILVLNDLIPTVLDVYCV
jgi:3-phenylpropionate/cinnamic acid dioxygenase small subunit